jgi:hypothetical protein
MVTSPNGLGPDKDYAGKGQQHIDRPVLSLERVTQKNKTVTVNE